MKPLIVKVIVRAPTSVTPVEFSVADSTGAIKGIWYHGPDAYQQDIERKLVPGWGAIVTNYRIGKNIIILSRGADVTKYVALAILS